MANFGKRQSELQDLTNSTIAVPSARGSVTRINVKAAIDEAAKAGLLTVVRITSSTIINASNERDYIGKHIDVTGGATVTIVTGISDNFVAYFSAVAQNATLVYPSGSYTLNFTLNSIKFINRGGGVYKIEETPVPVVQGGSLPASDAITGNISITSSNVATYKNKALYLDNGNTYTLSIASGVYCPLNLSVFSGTLNISVASAGASFVNQLKPDNDGAVGMLLIDVVGGNKYIWIGTENAKYIAPVSKPEEKYATAVYEYWQDYATVSGNVPGRKGIKNLTPVLHTLVSSGGPVQYNMPTLDAQGWLVFNGTDQLVALTFDNPPTQGGFSFVCKVTGTYNSNRDENMAGFCSGAVANNAMRAALRDQTGTDDPESRLYIRYSGNTNIITQPSSTDPDVTNRVYNTNDILFVYAYFNSSSAHMYIANLADSTFSPEYIEYLPVSGSQTYEAKPNFALGGEYRGSYSGSDRTPGKYKKIFVWNRDLTQAELQDIFTYYKSLNIV